MTKVRLTELERRVLEDIAAGNACWARAPKPGAARGAVTRLHGKGLLSDALFPHTRQKVTAAGKRWLGIP